MNIFITGINTGCGKTVISAGIASVMQSLGYNAGVYKPIQTAAINNGKYFLSPDLSTVKMYNPQITTHSTYMFQSKSIPVIASETENVDIDIENIVHDYKILSNKTDVMIVESLGGLMTPIKNNILTYHLPIELKIPIVFVVTPEENSLNNFLNELNTAKTAGLDIVGVIINNYQVRSQNPEIKSFPILVEKYTDIKVLGLIRHLKNKPIAEKDLFNEVLNGVDIEDVFRITIPKLHV